MAKTSKRSCATTLIVVRLSARFNLFDASLSTHDHDLGALVLQPLILQLHHGYLQVAPLGAQPLGRIVNG